MNSAQPVNHWIMAATFSESALSAPLAITQTRIKKTSRCCDDRDRDLSWDFSEDGFCTSISVLCRNENFRKAHVSGRNQQVFIALGF